MSYAIESKKRKFERILESLTSDSSAAQTRTSLNTRNNASTAASINTHSGDSSKRRRITPTDNAPKLNTLSAASLATHYLPSSRLAFLERLESFRQVTKWHIPSTSEINAVEWAKRGWTCQDIDTVSCLNCKERLHVDIDGSAVTTSNSMNSPDEQSDIEDDDSLTMTMAVSSGLTERYREMIITAHTQACPWRRRGCDNSIQRIEGLLNTSAALAGLEIRYESIAQENNDIPNVLSLPSSRQCIVDEQELDNIRLPNQPPKLDTNALKLAICGWQRKEDDIVECRHCFRSLGLWLYRGKSPTIENLDAVDSHLEYCPWRSETAQDTEFASPTDKGDPQKHKSSGWMLVYLVIVKKNHKGRLPQPDEAGLHLSERNTENLQPQLTPEQREKKMKDLMRRIRDLKKPFNVKSLLRKKDKPHT